MLFTKCQLSSSVHRGRGFFVPSRKKTFFIISGTPRIIQTDASLLCKLAHSFARGPYCSNYNLLCGPSLCVWVRVQCVLRGSRFYCKYFISLGSCLLFSSLLFCRAAYLFGKCNGAKHPSRTISLNFLRAHKCVPDPLILQTNWPLSAARVSP